MALSTAALLSLSACSQPAVLNAGHLVLRTHENEVDQVSGIAALRLVTYAIGQLGVELGKQRFEVVVALAGGSRSRWRAVDVHRVLAVRRLGRVLIDSEIQAAGDRDGHCAIGADHEWGRSVTVADAAHQSTASGAGDHQRAQGVHPATRHAGRSYARVVAHVDRAFGGDVQLVAGGDVHAGIKPLGAAAYGDVGAFAGGSGRGRRRRCRGQRQHASAPEGTAENCGDENPAYALHGVNPLRKRV